MKHNQINKTAAARTGKGVLELINKNQKSSGNGKGHTFGDAAELHAIWKNLLGHSNFSEADDFFQIGGNSLKAVQLVSRISSRFSVNIELADVFLHSVFVDQNKMILEKKPGGFHGVPVEKSSRPKHIPLSYSQERLWFIDQMEGSVHYHIPAMIKITGKLNKKALAESLREIVNRHEVLRTIFVEEEGEAYQKIQSKDQWQLEEAEPGNKKYLSAYIEQKIKQPFDIGKDHMLRATLLEQAKEEHLLVVTMHHIASDGWSMPVIVKEVTSLYRSYAENKPSELPPLTLQYADYAIWQRNYLKGELLENKLSYWKQKLSGVSFLELPIDYPRPLMQGMEGASVKFTIPKERASQLQELSRREGTTLFMTLLAGLNALLYRYSGQEDISIGTPVANRGQQEIEGLVGFFVNTLALRNHVSGNKSFQELLRQVRESTLEAYEHQEAPFEKVVDAVVKERDLSRTPLFQVMLALQNIAETGELALEELHLSEEPAPSNTSKFELTFTLIETSEGFQCSVQYNTELYKEETITRMATHFTTLLASIVKEPTKEIGKLRMLGKEEEQHLLIDFNNTSVSYPRDSSITAIIEQQVKATPEATAIIFEQEAISYKELNERSNQLAHYLRKRGVGEETLVPLCMGRSIEMIVSVLGILKAGGAYVPVDPEYPAERISYMVEDTEAKLIVSSKETRKEGIAKTGIVVIEVDGESVGEESTENLVIKIRPNQLAYVIYTSGSTGRPKGVMIEHQAVLDHCYGLMGSAGLKECKSFALFAPLVFDAGHAIIFSSLFLGASLNVISKDQVTDGEKLAGYLKAHPVDCIKIVPSVWLSYAGDGNRVLAEKIMIFGGEAFSGKIPEYLKKADFQGRVYNHYGPTEATIGKTIHTIDLQKKYAIVPIGKPFSNTQLYIIDANNGLVPAGVAGELCIAGDGLARGYLNQGELTKEKFILNPFGIDKSFEAKTGNLSLNPPLSEWSQRTPIETPLEEGREATISRLYKTGDKARWNAEGEIEYLGRIDEQVKIRGHRIELGEIENVLVQVAGVKAGAITVIEDTQGNRQLAGYVVSGGKTGKETIVQQLRGKLPEYMIPQVWTELEEMPLTSNGKVNKKALPKPDTSGLGSSVYTAPTSETETRLAAIWQELLGIERIGIHGNFFELGGHSLLAMRLISAIRRQMKVEVTVKNLFLYPTISLLSSRIGVGEGEELLPEIEVSARPSHIPLSFSQERLWFIDQLEGSVQYHLPVVLRLKGKLNREALSHSLQQIVNRHEVLRTVYREEEGKSWQYIKEKDSNKLEIIDGSRYNEDKKGLGEYIQKLTKAPFDLSRDNMLRVILIALGEEDHVMVATMHHIASDAWSTSILVKEVAELYSSYTEQRMANLPELPLQYADYSIWQRGYLQGELLEKKISYWKEKLEGVSTLQMPTDYKRPAVQSTRGSFAGFKIDKQLSGQLYDLSKKEGTTLFITMQAVYKAMLYRYSGQSDISVGTSIARREQQQLEGLIGFFVNTLALRDEVSGEQSFKELLRQVRTTTMEAYEHQEVPFEKVVETVIKERDKSRSPLFQVMLVLKNTPDVPQLKLGEVTLSGEGHEHTTVKFELTFFINETNNGLNCSVQYCRDLYNAETIARMMAHFTELARSAVKDPEEKIGKLKMLGEEEKQTLAKTYNNKTVNYPQEKSVVTLFEEQAAINPGAIAVVFEDEELTYKELNERANQLAHYLGSKGVKAETLVPLFVERSAYMVTGMLGILKAGAAYVPIDTEFPAERISFMLEDTNAKIVVSSEDSAEKLSETGNIEVVTIDDMFSPVKPQPKTNPEITITAEQLAYVIYTSGSTGNPKGVMVEHGNLIDYLYGLKDSTGIDQCKSFALVSTIATDLGNTVLFSSLIFGGALHVFTKEATTNIYGLHQYFQEHAIECIKIVPSHWKALSKDEELLLPTKLLVFGGEALHTEIVTQINQANPGCCVVNHYGPTETTIGKLLHVVQKEMQYGKTVPIGKPFSNTKVYVLSKDMELCPTGVPGQLYISGDGVARGYLNNEALTESKFVQNPFEALNPPLSEWSQRTPMETLLEEGREATRMYVTGDLVKYLPGGNIEFIGRVDNQVKIRGYRIELGEIENVLQQCDLVRQAVVLAKDDKQNNKRLLAYIVPKEEFNREGIYDYLKGKLPEYMLPAVMMEIEALPLTANGKVDRKALPDPESEDVQNGVYAAPGNEVEEKLVETWQEILEVQPVGIHDNFFELGGHSLLAIRLISMIRKELGLEVKIGDVFDYPTIALLSKRIAGQEDRALLPTIEVKERPARIPLSFSQERLWFIDQLDGSTQYHLPTILRLWGDLNTEALNYSLEQIVKRHEVLRTVFKEEGGVPFQHIKESGSNTLQKIAGHHFKENNEQLYDFIKQLVKAPFDLSKDNMLKVYLIELAPEDHVLVAVMHHISSDAWSTSIMVREVAELYNSFIENRTPQLPAMDLQYADYSIWQRNNLKGEAFEKKVAYWKEKMKEVAVLQLPTDYKRPSTQSTKGSTATFKIEKELSEQLNALNKKEGTTLFITLQAVYKALLYRYSGQSDISIGTSIARREQQQLEGLIGFFVNTLALRDEVNGEQSFKELLRQVRTTTMEAYAHQEVPFEKVVEVVVRERDKSRSPLFQVMLVLKNTPDVPELKLGDVILTAEGHHHTTVKFEITFFVNETAGGLQCSVQYCSELYTAETIKRMTDHFTELLKSVVKDPEEKIDFLQMLTEEEEQQLLMEFN